MAMSRTRKDGSDYHQLLVVLLLVVLIGFAMLVSAFRRTRRHPKTTAVLALRVSGLLPDYVPNDPLGNTWRNTEQSLSNLACNSARPK